MEIRCVFVYVISISICIINANTIREAFQEISVKSEHINTCMTWCIILCAVVKNLLHSSVKPAKQMPQNILALYSIYG